MLSDICNTLNLAVLVITESKLDETIPINLLTIPGYHEPVRRDRNRNGGGVLIYIAEYLVFQQISNLQSPLYEHIWMNINSINVTFSINALCRPPSETTESRTEFLQTCTDILKNLDNHTATYKIITSDLILQN